MKSLSIYLDFIRQKGRPLSEINPGSDEIALTIDNAFQALTLLKNSHTAILGGDILSEQNNILIYAYQLWGEEYIYLNWHCDKMESERDEDYLERSYTTAKESIINAKEVAERLKMECYIVFVIT